jgi:hypothetical protein
MTAAYLSPCCGLPLLPAWDGEFYCPCGMDWRRSKVPGHPSYDPTPWCTACGPRHACTCGPITDND